MTLLAFRRDSRSAPLERERLTVGDDGSATAWRTTGAAVGRFAGPAPGLQGLREAVEGIEGVDPPAAADPPPDASVDTLVVGGREVRFTARRTVEGPWGTLLEAAIGALEAMTASPVAAITGDLVTGEDAPRLRLRHEGTEPARLALDAVGLQVAAWRDRRQAGQGSSWEAGPGTVEAAPGWTLELALPVMTPDPGAADLVVTVGFGLEGESGLVPVTLTVQGPA